MITDTKPNFESLTDSQASQKRILFGLNELPQSKQANFFVRQLKLLKEPMFLFLIATVVVYWIIGDFGEGVLLSITVLTIVAISIYQEHKSEKALEALHELTSPRTLVIRGGIEQRIAATQLVPGDLIIVHEGDRVPADGIVLQTTHLMVDESLLTGESFPVLKSTCPTPNQDIKDIPNQEKIFSSTLVIRGTAFIRVAQTGSYTEIGKIGKSLQEPRDNELNLTKETRHIVYLLAWASFFICTMIVLLYGFTRQDWTHAILAGLATAMSLLPEELPVVLTLFLAMGAFRLSKVHVLVRKSSSIERLGAITALCVDKTGTLTKNQMVVSKLEYADMFIDVDFHTTSLDKKWHPLLTTAALASHQNLFDPMDRAIHHLSKQIEQTNQKELQFIRDYPISEQLLAMSCVWKNPSHYLIATKGAPEAIAQLCQLGPQQTQHVLSNTFQMAQSGLRVLAVAKASFSGAALPQNQQDFPWEWVGLIGLSDPLRLEVPFAVQTCKQAGIRVFVMTGDHPETALQIAKQAGLDDSPALLTGSQIQDLSDAELQKHLQTVCIFARMAPIHKMRIIQNLQTLGHIVAMTGDGINDAPSLKQANVGIAMGERGTDVAREASDMVLLDDNFTSIVSGIERGRLIFNNIQKAISYLVSIHVPIAGLSLLPLFFGWPLVLMPIHIVFLELIIDPACSLLFESLEGDPSIMRQPPRHLHERLFSMHNFLHSLLKGTFIFATIAILLAHHMSIYPTHPNHSRTLIFIILTMSNIGLIFADMGDGSLQQLKNIFKKISNKIIPISIALFLILVSQFELLQPLFYFELLHYDEVLFAFGFSFLIFSALHISNWYIRTKLPYRSQRIL